MSVSDAARGSGIPPRSPALVILPEAVAGLSARSYGVYCYMIMARTDWFTVTSLMEVFSDRRDGLNTTMGELIRAGLVATVERREKNLLRHGYRVTS